MLPAPPLAENNTASGVILIIPILSSIMQEQCDARTCLQYSTIKIIKLMS